jgi:hypothetical protein
LRQTLAQLFFSGTLPKNSGGADQQKLQAQMAGIFFLLKVEIQSVSPGLGSGNQLLGL